MNLERKIITALKPTSEYIHEPMLSRKQVTHMHTWGTTHLNYFLINFPAFGEAELHLVHLI